MGAEGQLTTALLWDSGASWLSFCPFLSPPPLSHQSLPATLGNRGGCALHGLEAWLALPLLPEEGHPSVPFTLEGLRALLNSLILQEGGPCPWVTLSTLWPLSLSLLESLPSACFVTTRAWNKQAALPPAT